MKKSILTSAFAVLAAASLAVSPMVIKAQDDVIATIGEKTITKDDLYEAMKNVSGEVTLRTLILEQVLMQNVEDADALKKSAEEEVQKQIDSAGGEDVFQELLNYQQLGSVEEFTYQMFVSKMFEEVVKKEIDLSDEAVKKFYEEEYSPLMEAQHILVDTEEEAQNVIQRLNDGEEFDALAQELSKDSTAQNGGLLSPFTSGQMVPEFEEAVKSMKNGGVTQEPVKSEYGYHVIKVINNGEKKPLDEIRKEVEDQLVQKKLADTNFAYGIVGNLIKNTGYEIKDEDLKNAVEDLVNGKQDEPASSEEKQEDTSADGADASQESQAAEESETAAE
ncbi:peptidylprolyl isomerase [Ignavigranum ruoffiae]|uniref:peptidylprolyl isomerase n=1 Tax=Ignavigranum ruoffiae TaxID=89093 RepID=UPI0023544180|nr:peptidylprolyl isomerase [Ignavigranum ruoffiae]